MAFLDFLLGKKQKTRQFQQFTPQQQSVLNNILSQASRSLPQQTQYLESLLSPGSQAEEAFASPAFRQFNEQILPSIAERFTGQFGEGSQRSSAFGQQLGQAGAGLAERLAALRASLAGEGISGLRNLLGAGLGQQFQNVTTGGSPGLLQGLLGGLRVSAIPGLPGVGFGGF